MDTEKSKVRQTVMVLDDAPPVLDFIREVLGDAYDLRLVKTVMAGFGVINSQTVDLLLLDVDMPAMDGLEFLTRAREIPNFKNTRVIMITGHDDKRTVTKAAKLGAKGYIVKPIDADILRAKVHEALES